MTGRTPKGEQMSEPTPRPWVVNRGKYAFITNALYKGIVADICYIAGEEPLFVCHPGDHYVTPEQYLPNAELICRAVNSHDALVSALRGMDDAIGRTYWTSDDGEAQRHGTPQDGDVPEPLLSAWQAVRAALSLVGGPEPVGAGLEGGK
jgi:hypothetical protein